MPGFISRIFGGGGSSSPPAPRPAPKPMAPAAPIGNPAQDAAAIQQASDKKRLTGKGRNTTQFTDPLGISPTKKSGLARKYLTGA